MTLIDAAFVGRTSSVALAALGPASTISDSLLTLLVFLSVATTNMVATAMGTGEADVDKAARATTIGLALATVSGVVFGAAIFRNAAPLTALYAGAAAPPELVPLAAAYVRIRALALPAALAGCVAQAACIGARDTVTPMLSVALGAGLNFVGDCALVPKQGIVGAAIATAVSQYAAVVLLSVALARKGFIGGPRLFAAKPSRPAGVSWSRDIWPFFRYGPFMFCCLMKLVLHNSAAMTAVALGGVNAAAHTVIYSVAIFCFVLGDVGTSLALAYLTPYYNEETKVFDLEAAKATINSVLRVCWSISAVCVAVSSLIIARGAAAFTADQAVIQSIRKVLPLTAATLAMHCSAVTLEGLLLIKRDFKFLCAVYAVIGLGVVQLHSQILKRGLGLSGVWAVYVAFQVGRTAVFAWQGGLISPFDSARRLGDKFFGSRQKLALA
ncbi:hypothetical protein M885DRAFT_540329 [Pelagophyceae sp. CCMP2097]|nr:hypothetical protein M885DRAFT_540329 [Pelagophyceae sp. CCMP2097]